MWFEGKFNEYTKTERGVRQGCIFSSDQFELPIVTILRLENLLRFIIGEHNLNNIRYLLDTLLMTDSQE